MIKRKKLSATSKSVWSMKTRVTWISRSSTDRTSWTFASKIETRVPQDKLTSSLQRHIRREETLARLLSICLKYWISLLRRMTNKHRLKLHSNSVFSTTRRAKGRTLKSLQNFWIVTSTCYAKGKRKRSSHRSMQPESILESSWQIRK